MGGSLAYRYVFFQNSQQGMQAEFASAGRKTQEVIGTRRPDFSLGSNSNEIISAGDFDGQVVLINFWATWCKPCREEMPMLVNLHHEYNEQGLVVIGIAMEKMEKAAAFAAELGVDYEILAGTTDVMVVAKNYGNLSGALPYSVLIDRDGIIRWTELGVLDEKELKRQLGKLLP